MNQKRWISLILVLVTLITMLPAPLTLAEQLAAQGLSLTGVETDEDGKIVITGEQELEGKPVTPEELAEMPVNTVLNETKNIAQVTSVTFDSGKWQYELDDDGYAIITACTAPEAMALQVPESIDGHLVRGIGPRAFETVKGLQTLDIPSSVMDIAPTMLGSLRTQVTIRAYNGTPAMVYAKKYAVNYNNLSQLYFTEKVIDYTGARSGAYQLIDGDTVRFSALEGSQLKSGSLFFLPETREAYCVTAISNVDGMVVVTTTEPDARDVLTRVVADFSKMQIDTEGIELGSGVTMLGGLERAGMEASFFSPIIPLDWNSNPNAKEGELNVNIKGELEFSMGLDGELDIDVFALKLNKFRFVLKYTFKVDVSIAAQIKLVKIPIIKIPFFSALVADVNAKLNLEVEAEASLHLTYTTEREFGFEYNKKTKKFDPVDVQKTTKGISVEGKLAVKVCPSATVDVAVLGEIAAVSVGLGVEVEAKTESVKEEDSNETIGSSQEEYHGDIDYHGNCMDLEVSLVGEAKAEIDIGALFDLEIKIFSLKIPLFSCHMERIPGRVVFEWRRVQECTYDSKNFVSLFLDRNDGTPIEETRVPRGQSINFRPMVGKRHGYAAGGWYLDENFEEKLTNETVFNEDTTIYFLWVENGHSLNVYDSLMGNKSMLVSAGAMLSDYLDSDSMALQYVFHGWYYDQAYTQPVELDTDQMPAAATNVYAKWEYKADHNPFTDAYLQKLLRFALNEDYRSYSVVGFVPGTQVAEIPDMYLGKPVTGIATNAFKDCTSLRFLNLGENVDFIGTQAFQGCTSLNYVGLNDNLRSIGELAFQGCTALETITLPDGLETIDEDAFKDSTLLKEIEIPASIQYLGAGSFYGCTGLIKASLPNHLTSIPNGLFRDCSSLTTVNIPTKAVTIDQYAFANCAQLNNITLPEGLLNIYSKAFRNCKALSAITLPSTLKCLEGESFYGCSALTTIELPASITSCGGAFEQCTGLLSATIPDRWTSIPGSLFSGCSSLRTVNMPSALTSIGGWAFSQCAALTGITLPNTVKTIGNKAFNGCSSLTRLSLPDSITSLGVGALSCSGVTEVTLPPLLTAVPDSLCSGMPALTRVVLHDAVTTIGSRSFAECTALTGIALPSSVTTIKDSAFAGSGLTAFVFSDSIQSLGEAIFKNCPALASVSIPDGWTTLTNELFYGCTALKSITLPSALTTLGKYLFAESGLESIDLPDGIKSIPSYVFKECTSLAEVELPASLQTIGREAFFGCTILPGVFVPYGTVTLADWSFGLCPGLSYIYLPPTVTSIGDHSFYVNYFGGHAVSFNCEAESYAATFADEHELLWFPYTYENAQSALSAKSKSTADGFIYVVDDKGAHIVGYEGNVTGALTIPAVLDGEPVVSIEAGAMTGSFTSVTLPVSLQEIDPAAFEPAVNLTRFSLSGTSEFFQVLNYVVYDKKSPMSLIAYPRGRTGAFTVPNTVGIIAENAFAGSVNLTSLTLGSGVTVIDSYAFAACPALASVKLNSGLLSIGDMSFYNCAALKTLDIPDSVTDISDTALSNCHLDIFGAVGDCTAREFAQKVMMPYNQYKLSYYLEGKLLGTTTVEAGQLLQQVAAPEDQYSTFDGWYKESTFKNLWDFTTGVMPESALSLYSRWTSDFACKVSSGKATITGYGGNMGVLVIPESIGGVPVTAIAANAIAGSDENPLLCVTIPACVTTIEDGALTGVEEIIGDRGAASESYALANGLIFTAREYTVSFECGNATPVADRSLAAGDSLVLPEPVLDNHVLCGWFTSDTYLEPFTSNVMPAGDLTLYALWVRCDGAAYNNNLRYTYTDDGVEITGYDGEAFELIIPDTINGLPVVSVGNSAFYGQTDIRKIVLPDSVTTIGWNAFSDSSISEISLGSGITSIGDSAFAGCAMLNQISIPAGVTRIPQGMMSGCAGIRTLVLGDQITEIGDYAFSGMSRLKTITLGESIVSIGAYALSDCPQLIELNLPASVTEIGEAAFSGNTSLSILTVDNKNTAYMAQDNVLYTKDEEELIAYAAGKPDAAFEVPEGVTDIADSAFAKARKLQSVSLPSSLQQMGTGVFSHCYGLKTCLFNPESQVLIIPQYTFAGCIHLNELRLPESLLKIEEYALQDAAELTLLKIPASIQIINTTAFSGCNALMLCAALDSFTEEYASLNGIDFVADGDKVLVRQIILPLAISMRVGEKVSLDPRVLPAEADDRSLIWSSSDTSVAIVSDKGAVTACGTGEVIITATAVDGSEKFTSCRVIVTGNMTTMTLPAQLTVIEAEAFSNLSIQCVDLTATQCTTIGARAFADSSSLVRILIPDSVTSIGEGAFDGCTNLTIVCPSGSAAARYAQANGIPWEQTEQ